MDEPTAGLDPIISDTINELILRMRDRLGVTVLCITHDLASTFRIADRIAMLHGGKIVAYGAPDAVRASDEPVVRQFLSGRADGPLGGAG